MRLVTRAHAILIVRFFSVLPRAPFFADAFSVMYVTVFSIACNSNYWQPLLLETYRSIAAVLGTESLRLMTDLAAVSTKRPKQRAQASKNPRRGGRLTEARQREIVAQVAPLFIEHGYEQ